MKKRKKKKQRSPEENAANRGTEVAHSSARAGSIFGPPLNLALTDEPRNVSPEVPLWKKKSRQASEPGTTRRQVPLAAAPPNPGVSAPGSSAPGSSTGGAPVVRKTLMVEFTNRISFEYDGPTPIIYAPNRRAELVSQIKCGPKSLPPVVDLIFQDEYIDAARTKLLVRVSPRLLHLLHLCHIYFICLSDLASVFCSVTGFRTSSSRNTTLR